MNEQEKEMFDSIAQLLAFVYQNSEIHLPKEDEKSIAAASRWLVRSLVDTFMANRITQLGVQFDQSGVKYDSVERTLEFDISLVDDMEIVCGIQLMRQGKEDLPEQKDERLKEYFTENGIRGVYVYFKTNVLKNGEEIEVEQGIASQREVLHPHILNKLSSEPNYLN
jgi:hypothetical protein